MVPSAAVLAIPPAVGVVERPVAVPVEAVVALASRLG